MGKTKKKNNGQMKLDPLTLQKLMRAAAERMSAAQAHALASNDRTAKLAELVKEHDKEKVVEKLEIQMANAVSIHKKSHDTVTQILEDVAKKFKIDLAKFDINSDTGIITPKVEKPVIESKT